ncbi:MAG: ABC transporter substrate-binding protein [Ichthyobacteriaceae bacterium]|nr:ABC transporter substrate-binding protein [Ichthyobacteriaceae bacterium]
MKHAFKLLILLFIFQSCKNTANNTDDNIATKKSQHLPLDTIITSKLNLSYSNGFAVDYYKTHKKITVFNPWKKNEIYCEYYVVKDSLYLRKNTKDKFYLTQVNNSAVLSAVTIAMIDKLGEIDKIKSISEPKYIYNKKIHSLIKSGKIEAIGDFVSFNMEKAIYLNHDAIFTSGFDKSNKNFAKLIELGTSIIYTLDWQETSPLGRAEWIKFVGAFFDKENNADKYFSNVENKYMILKNIASKSETKPTVIIGSVTGDAWYVAGGNSYISNFLKDANSNYIFNYIKSTGSTPLNIEVVLNKGIDADIWLNYATKLNENFTENDSRYRLFKAYKNKNIFLNSKKLSENGGNDYWEKAVINPDKQLSDYINIFHPNLLNDKKLNYYKKLQ